MGAKTEFLQIRVTGEQKAALRRLAEQAGQDVSAFVLSRALPETRSRFAELVAALRIDDERSFVLAELNEFLSALSASAFSETVVEADLRSHSDFARNYLAAMVEQAAALKDCVPPRWTSQIEALEEPWFATDLKSLRPHLLVASPVPFRRRNLFIDSGIGSRV